MLYNVYVCASFQNVRHIVASQTYPVFLRCLRCGVDYDKCVIVYGDKKISKGKSDYTCFTCLSCGTSMGISIKLPNMHGIKCINAATGESVTVMSIPNSMSKDRSLVSMLDAQECEVTDVIKLDFSVITSENIVFTDVSLDDNSWVGTYGEDVYSFIEDYEIMPIPS